MLALLSTYIQTYLKIDVDLNATQQSFISLYPRKKILIVLIKLHLPICKGIINLRIILRLEKIIQPRSEMRDKLYYTDFID